MHILNGEMFRAEEARIHGHLFENPRMGIPRGIYWALFVQFEPVSLDSEEWPSSLGCEWIEWPIRRWEELDGREVTVTKTSEVSTAGFGRNQAAKRHNLAGQKVFSRLPKSERPLGTRSQTLDFSGP